MPQEARARRRDAIRDRQAHDGVVYLGPVQLHPCVKLDAEDWDKLPDRFGFEPAREAEWRDLLAALRRAVDTELSPRQCRAFVAIVVNAVPLDALAIELSSNRNAIYKTMFDARRKLRAALGANGYIGHNTEGHA